MRTLFTLIVSHLLIFSSNAVAQLDFAPEGHFDIHDGILSDSGIDGVPYREIQADMERLASTNDYVNYVSLGQTLGGRYQDGVLIQEPGQVVSQLVMVTGAIHGNEYLNIADRMIHRFADKNKTTYQDFFARGGALLVVPIINPDGYEADRRHNNNWKDLNRDFPNPHTSRAGQTQPESRNVVRFVQDYTNQNLAKLSLVVDYHCCLGSLLHPLGYTRRNTMPKEDLDAHREIARGMKEIFPGNYTYGTPIETVGYTADGTTLDYWYLAYNALTFTFEGARGRENQNLELHDRWFQKLLGDL